eukprot:SAG22_NODE_490_length_9834_cov_7.723780_8_plen_191_part_00
MSCSAPAANCRALLQLKTRAMEHGRGSELTRITPWSRCRRSRRRRAGDERLRPSDAAAGHMMMSLLLLFLPVAPATGRGGLVVGRGARPAAAQPPAVGALTSGVYRNLFAEAGYPQAEIDAKLERAFDQLYFRGDPETERIYYEVAAERSAYVTDVKNGDVRTEGMGYGMMAMVQRGNQTGFDMLWHWVR